MWIFLSPQMWIFLPPSWARNVQEKPRCRLHSTTAYTIGARGAKFGLIADATWSFYILVTRLGSRFARTSSLHSKLLAPLEIMKMSPDGADFWYKCF